MNSRTFLVDLPGPERLALMYPNRVPLGRNLRYLRGMRDLTQEELSKLAHVTTATIAAIENGSSVPQLRTLQKLAAALDVTLSMLMEGV